MVILFGLPATFVQGWVTWQKLVLILTGVPMQSVRYRKRPRSVAATAIARELAGFLWEAMNTLTSQPPLAMAG